MGLRIPLLLGATPKNYQDGATVFVVPPGKYRIENEGFKTSEVHFCSPEVTDATKEVEFNFVWDEKGIVSVAKEAEITVHFKERGDEKFVNLFLVRVA